MNNDKELLELAAKAAGVDVERIDAHLYHIGTSKDWNPLTDDGDALRLAVRLGMDTGTDTVNQSYANDCWEFHCDHLNRYAATRRAIVRAAAEIGKTK